MISGVNQNPQQPNRETVVAEVLDLLRRSREFLLDPTPQNVDCCRMIMAQCAGRLEGIAHDPESNPQAREAFAASIHLVREELRRIAGLLAAAARFRHDLVEVMRVAEPAPAIPSEPLEAEAPEKARRVQVLC